MACVSLKGPLKPGDGPVKALKSLGDLILFSGDLNPTPKIVRA